MTSAQELLRQHDIAYQETRQGSYTTTCPNCGGGYCNVKIKRDGVVWFCHTCGEGGGDKFEKDGKGKGGGLGPIKAVYEYPDETGKRLFQVLRFEPLNAPKQFRQRTGPDQKEWSIKGVRRVLFCLPELIEDLGNERVIFLVEGEKDVLTLRKHGVPATTAPMGATTEDKQAKGTGWMPSYSETLRGADVVLLADNDKQGHEHVRIVARCLHGIARRIRVLDLAKVWQDIEVSDDVSDWFERGAGSVEQLWRIVEQLPDWSPPSSGNGEDHAARASIWTPGETPSIEEQRETTVQPDVAIGLVRASDVEIKPVEWLWSNHLARGKMTLLSGDSELGKSQISIDLIARLTKGGEWPDGDPAPLGSAVILSSEDAIDDTIVPRLAAADADLTRVHCLTFVRCKGVARTFSLQADLQQLGAKLRAIGDVLLVVIDPVTSYMGTKVDSHRTTEVRAVLEPLSKFAEEFRIAVLMISHPQKHAATKALNAVTGSGAFVHAPRMHFICIKDPENKGRSLLLASKNNIGPKADGLGYSIVSTFVGPNQKILSSFIAWDSLPVRVTADEALEAAAEKRGGSASADAEDFLRERLTDAPRPVKDIEGEASALGISKRTLQRARKKLGVKAAKDKDDFAAGWRLFLDKEKAGGTTS